MTRYRGDDIPTVEDYSHWNEDAEYMWYSENKYDMEHAGEVLDDFEDEDYDRAEYEAEMAEQEMIDE